MTRSISAVSLMFSLGLSAQVAASPAFEAASVKPSNPDTPDHRISFRTSPDGVTITNEQLKFLIPYAFNIAVYQLSGGPSWLDTNRYDIIARAATGSSEDKLKLMVQTLLAERFKLKFHREQKDLSVYALVLAKDGPKFQIEKREKQDGDGKIGAALGVVNGHMVSGSVFAQTLSLSLNRPILDQTGIGGLFNVALKWVPDETERQFGPSPPTENHSADPLAGPSLFDAIQEQLGLKLVSRRAWVEMFVIDHLEQVPTEN